MGSCVRVSLSTGRAKVALHHYILPRRAHTGARGRRSQEGIGEESTTRQVLSRLQGAYRHRVHWFPPSERPLAPSCGRRTARSWRPAPTIPQFVDAKAPADFTPGHPADCTDRRTTVNEQIAMALRAGRPCDGQRAAPLRATAGHQRTSVQPYCKVVRADDAEHTFRPDRPPRDPDLSEPSRAGEIPVDRSHGPAELQPVPSRACRSLLAIS